MRRASLASVLAFAILTLGPLVVACGSGGDLTSSGRSSVALVTVSPASARVEIGSSVQLSAELTNAEGDILGDRVVSWTSSTSIVATVTTQGLVTGVAAGTTTISAASEGKSATATIIVGVIPVAVVEVSPLTAEVPVGSSIQLAAVVRGDAGEVLPNRAVTWVSSTPTVARVGVQALVTGVMGIGPGTTTITATSGGKSGIATITVPPFGPVTSVRVSPPTVLLENFGPAETTSLLGATVHDAAGNQLSGHSVQWSSNNDAVATVSSSGLVQGKLYGQATITASVEGHAGSGEITVVLLFGIPVPVPVRGGHSFASLSANGFNTCGLDRAGGLHCWGAGPTQSITFGTPAPRFSSVASGGGLVGNHMCALTSTGQAYCWGENVYGQLGSGSVTYTNKPEPVAGDHTFAYLSTGQTHSCGLTTAGIAYCWGLNFAGELGTGGPSGDEETSLVPVAVTGELRFKTIGTGDDHTCGLTDAGRAYCWGENDNGEVGDGTRVNRLAPVAVAGGRTFTSLAVGGEHTCGLTPTGAVYCWGFNNQGAFTVGPGDRLTPVLVSGALTFVSLVAGGAHDCALTSAGAAYCWGQGFFGQLGDRSGKDRLSLAPVYGDLTFTSVTVGGLHSCGLQSSGAAYCWGHNENGELGNGP